MKKLLNSLVCLVLCFSIVFGTVVKQANAFPSTGLGAQYIQDKDKRTIGVFGCYSVESYLIPFSVVMVSPPNLLPTLKFGISQLKGWLNATTGISGFPLRKRLSPDTSFLMSTSGAASNFIEIMKNHVAPPVLPKVTWTQAHTTIIGYAVARDISDLFTGGDRLVAARQGLGRINFTSLTNTTPSVQCVDISKIERELDKLYFSNPSYGKQLNRLTKEVVGSMIVATKGTIIAKSVVNSLGQRVASFATGVKDGTLTVLTGAFSAIVYFVSQWKPAF